MSDKSYTIFLIKANWCGHCNHFFPIFEEASKNKPECEKKLKYISYDVVDGKTFNHSENKEEPKNNNYKNYIETIEVEGYPTILFLIEDNGKIEKKIEINDRGETSTDFNNKISNTINTIESDGKSETIMVGGNRKYESKYLKYKLKYLELKKILNK